MSDALLVLGKPDYQTEFVGITVHFGRVLKNVVTVMIFTVNIKMGYLVGLPLTYPLIS